MGNGKESSALDKVKEELPSDSMISEQRYEGSNIIFYTQNKDFFLDNEKVVKKLVNKLKKRVEIRPSPNITMDPDKALKKIKEIVPKDAELDDVKFEVDFGKVILRAGKPGLAIGNNGQVLEEIKKRTSWMPQVERVPAIKSKVVDKARQLIHENTEFRKKFLDDVGKKIRLKKSIGDEWIRATFLGGYRQVGRSSTLLQTEGSSVLLDCGINTGSDDAYPYLNVPELDLKRLDAVILTHAHMDHCGFIPYLYEYGYEGPIYCTPPTRDLMILLQLDYIDVARNEGKKPPYTSDAIKEEVKRCITLEYDEVSDITPDMRLTFKNAGHILGSASAHIHVGEGLHNIVYTGDYNYSKSELLNPADPSFNRVETLITESTYGDKEDGEQPDKEDANEKLLNSIKQILDRNGKAIIPVFAVGRAQEIMILLAREHKKGNMDVPVYLDGMIWDATALHTAYPEYLSKRVQSKIFRGGENPFLSPSFNRVGSTSERKKVIEGGPAIILTTSGMVTGGPVMTYLEELADDEKNGVIFVGFQAAGTLGRAIQRGEKEVKLNSEPTKINASVATVEGLSAHSDRNQLIKYVSKLPNRPKKVITCHGDSSSTFGLASSLHKMYNLDTIAPQNLETIRLH